MVRRSATAALNVEAAQFLKGEESTVLDKVPERAAPKPTTGLPPGGNQEEDQATVSMTFRLTRGMRDRLRVLVTGRKIARVKPDTAQDVITEALEEWLDTAEEQGG